MAGKASPGGCGKSVLVEEFSRLFHHLFPRDSKTTMRGTNPGMPYEVYVMNMGNVCVSFMQVAIEKAGSLTKLEEAVGIPRQTLAQWADGKRTPSVDKFYDILKYVDAAIVRVGHEGIHKVNFDNLTLEDEHSPSAEDYIAVPVVKNPDLLVGDDFFVPQSNIAATTMSLATYKTARGRKHQVGLFIRDNSMAPLLEPGDVVYVDRADTAVHSYGHLYLVRDAATGHVCVRRVEEQVLENDTMLHFYADSKDVSPAHYSVNQHYKGNRRDAILGRVLWGRIELLDL